jgi:hypothetical protein
MVDLHHQGQAARGRASEAERNAWHDERAAYRRQARAPTCAPASAASGQPR